MSDFSASLDLDANNKPIYRGDLPFRTKRSITLLGGTTDAWGNDGGALDGGALFEVTGVVKVVLLGEVNVNLAGGATIEVGIAGATAIFMPQETDTNLDAGHVWMNEGTPAAYYIIGEEQAAADNLPTYLLNGQDIILTISGGASTTAGQIDFYALWSPISDDGEVKATTT
jgi:hypothetical protein